MQCSICGKQKPLIYTNIYLKNGCCADCYREAKLVYDWAQHVFTIVQNYQSEGSLWHLIYKDAFGDILFDKAYKRKGNLYRALRAKVSRIMGTLV